MIGPRRIVAGARRRLVHLVKGESASEQLLEMVWPQAGAPAPTPMPLPHGYTLRQFKTGDETEYFRLLAGADMGRCRLDYWENHLLPGGFFVIEHALSGALVATCLASHHPAPRHPRAGNLGWLAADPGHQGRGLGRAAAAAVTARLIAAGYTRVYLETHDFRLPAIGIYLTLGWVPLIYAQGMEARWTRVHQSLGRIAQTQAWIYEAGDGLATE